MIGTRFKKEDVDEEGTLVWIDPPILRLDSGFYIYNINTVQCNTNDDDEKKNENDIKNVRPPPQHVIRAISKLVQE